MSSIDNAEKIIERFGGIRPMAKKMNVAVTTVQGWKKRNAIPAARRSEVIKAANNNGIEITDLLVIDTDNITINKEKNNDEFNNSDNKKIDIDNNTMTHAQIMTELNASRNKAVINSVLMVLFIIGSISVASYLLLAPKVTNVINQGQDITILKEEIKDINQNVENVRKEQIALMELIPSDLQNNFNKMKQTTDDIKNQITDLNKIALNVGGNINKLDNIDMDKLFSRLSLLEGQVQDISSLTGSEGLAEITTRLQELKNIDGGDEILQTLMSEIEDTVINDNINDKDIGIALEKKAAESEIVGIAFNNVNAEEMKAAALLLALNQFRDSLNRDKSSFDTDLVLLNKLMGNSDNPELIIAMDKLKPHAKEGVLTPNGLSTEFRSLAGEIIIESLSGEEVSIREKAVSRLNQVVKIEKEGNLITGTETEQKVAQAQNLLDQGKIEEALIILNSLDGNAGKKAQPFIINAQNTLMANDLKNIVTGSVMNKISQMASDAFTTSTNSKVKYINR